MALNIKDPETDRLARELAARMGTSITEALKAALKDRLARSAPRVDVVYADLIAIGERGRRRANRSDLSAEEIVGYDEHGLPV
ncbi:type II toxin-antitoxin system VapB family antitoxin [Nocardioides carbamazepini]|jgi:antitoxin VapB|uniref:type II toxin-antitoxin system VapB family antitoxin n=1 Tax=Nocardioides carbamazepini TaxID=2854259 RepID=UPI002149D9C1|nr:type II toxin-antitoxin system VapB family antitoxin [Nocardioides carbamazepini]MCR1785234.1 type II toxin-antitoxin system VapB family antitoxin [Nocardioides carbamazepini]